MQQIQLHSDWPQRKKQLLGEISKMEKHLRSVYFRDLRLRERAVKRVHFSGNIKLMDGSIQTWLGVVASAKKDFVMYYDHPQKWDIDTPQGHAFVTAYALLFRDDYFITLSVEGSPCPECNPGGLIDPQLEEGKICNVCEGFEEYGGWIEITSIKEVNLKQLFDLCIESLSARRIEPAFMDLSVDHMRKKLANRIGDPWLIEKVKQLEKEANEVL